MTFIRGPPGFSSRKDEWTASSSRRNDPDKHNFRFRAEMCWINPPKPFRQEDLDKHKLSFRAETCWIFHQPPQGGYHELSHNYNKCLKA